MIQVARIVFLLTRAGLQGLIDVTRSLQFILSILGGD